MRLLARLARRTRLYDFTVWFWGDAIALDGLLDSADLLGDEPSRQHALRFLDTWSQRPLSYVDHLAPGDAAVRAAVHGSWPSLLEAARRLAVLLAVLLAEAPRAGELSLYRPDDPRYRHTAWVDSLYHVPVFLARLALVDTMHPRYDDAVRELTAHLRALTPQDSVFPAHSWDTGALRVHGEGWGRGVGWAVLG